MRRSLLLQLLAVGLSRSYSDDDRIYEQALAQCDRTLRSPSPQGFHCGESGTLDPSLTATIGSPTTVQTNDDCRDRCFATDGCKTWTFNTRSKSCTVYSKTLNSQGFRKTRPNGIVNYNRHCYECLPGGWRALCGNNICGQAYKSTISNGYLDDYIAECDSRYDLSLAYQINTAPDVVSCVEQCDEDYCCHSITFDHNVNHENNCYFFLKPGNTECTTDDGSSPPLENDKIFYNRGFSSAVSCGDPDSEGYRNVGGNYNIEICPVPRPKRATVCNADVQSNHGQSGCFYTPHCSAKWLGQPVATFTSATYNGCLDACDKNLLCYYMHFNAQSLQCQFFEEVTARLPVPDLSYDSADYAGGCG